MEHPTISVVMSVYNERPEWLRASIESILGQTYPHIEFIILLDAPDNAVLEAIVREYAARDDRIVFLKNSNEERGRVFSLNRGVASAGGAYIAIMDADDISEPDRLERELRTIESEHLDLVSGWIRYIHEDDTLGDAPEPPYPLPGHSPDAFAQCLRWGNMSAQPSWLVRAETYRAVGPYHEIPRAEDYEWLCRAAAAGMRMRNLDVPVLRYRKRRGSISVDGAYTQALTAEAVRREYRRALARGRGMDEERLQRRIAGFAGRRGSARYPKARALYVEAWKTMENDRLAGLAGILRAFCTCPFLLRERWNQFRMRRVREAVAAGGGHGYR